MQDCLIVLKGVLTYTEGLPPGWSFYDDLESGKVYKTYDEALALVDEYSNWGRELTVVPLKELQNLGKSTSFQVLCN